MGAKVNHPRYEQVQTRLTDYAYRWLYNKSALSHKSISRVMSDLVEAAMGADK